MSTLRVALFGKPTFEPRLQGPGSQESGKAHELLCYLLLFRGQSHRRETLAATLWEEQPPQRARQYLRKAIWQVQAAFQGTACGTSLRVDNDEVSVSKSADLWLDVADFEACCEATRGTNARDLSRERADGLRRAVALHTGELLRGWSQEWCLLERERLELLYLAALDKLVAYSEHHGEIEAGIDYALRILREDPAHERSHRALMRLYYRAGDRTAALRQFERCAAVLRKELDVSPSPRTCNLRDRIRRELVSGPPRSDGIALPVAPADNGLATRLRRLQRRLAVIQQQLSREIDSIDGPDTK